VTKKVLKKLDSETQIVMKMDHKNMHCTNLENGSQKLTPASRTVSPPTIGAQLTDCIERLAMIFFPAMAN
jgi:hypothetical protein